MPICCCRCRECEQSVCFVWVLVSLCIFEPVLPQEKEGEMIARGGFGVILKTGYRDDKC